MKFFFTRKSLICTQFNHSFVPQIDLHKYEAEIFARELCYFLEKAHAAQEFQNLFLVTGPHFMSLLEIRL